MFDDGYGDFDIEKAIPTINVIRALALKDAANISINWENMDAAADKEMVQGKLIIGRLPAIEKMYNTWRSLLMEDDPSAISAAMWVYENIVEELFAGYQMQDLLARYEAIKSIEALDKGL